MSKGRASARSRAAAVRKLAFGLAGAALIVAVPSTVYAVGLIGGSDLSAPAAGFASFTPASGDPRVAQIVAERRDGATPFLRFTPAGASDGGSRSVTVAVRVDQEVARAISARSATAAAGELRAEAQGLRIAPTRYNLGIARGYQSFARPAPLAVAPMAGADIPDLADFVPSPGTAERPSRFAARVQVEEGEPAAQVGPQVGTSLVRRPGGSAADQTLDVAGSYRLTRNLDVTAGVRYSQDRGLAPLPELEEQDSQAIYIGTQFRF